MGKAPGNAFQLVLFVLARIDQQAALGSAKRDIDYRTLVGHQSCECLGFVLVHNTGLANSPFCRQSVFAVDCSPAGEGPIFPVQFDGEADLINEITGLDLLGKPGRKIESSRGPIEHAIYAADKRLFLVRDSWWRFHLGQK